jgi:hypothetical protein
MCITEKGTIPVRISMKQTSPLLFSLLSMNNSVNKYLRPSSPKEEQWNKENT